ncbi:3-hydroxyacyl-CoA dehydrogenase NAD-binding domain-containing protein [Rhodococcus koreensis]
MSISTIRRTDRGSVAVLALDYPDQVMNVVDERLLKDLNAAVDAVLADEAVTAVVLASAKTTFGAGADVSWLPELARRPDAEEFLAGVHRLMVAVTVSPKPIVAAVNGSAFGGALELALGSQALVASTDARLGLPEVGLGLLPGGGGTQLLRRFVPIDVAAELLTSGRHVDANEAKAIGLVHEVVELDVLLDEAVAVAQLLAADNVSPRTIGDESTEAIQARRRTLLEGRSGLGAAAAKILDVLEAGVVGGLEVGLAAERRGFLELLRSPAARAAIHLFQIEGDVKRRSRGGGTDFARLGVIGGGQMGSGIAATAVTRGLSAVVRDVSVDSLERSRAYLDKVLSRTGVASDAVDTHWAGTTEWEGFDKADAVVEAVFELPELKQEILGMVAKVVDDTTLIATNTSAISIADLSGSVSSPDRFIGMHFFSPVERMPLVELIPHSGTSIETAARAAALGRRLGKTPITVGDAPGFFTSRVYARWLLEGIRLLLDGVAPGEVDAAARSVGFPIGPLQAHDEATLELVLQASVGQVAVNVMAERLDVARIRSALERLVASGVRGRRHGLGFYRYDDSGKRVGPHDEVLDLLGVARTELDAAVVGERLLLAFVSECLLCWDDGTLCHPDDGDLGAILGIGFPRALGGPFHLADEVGAPELLNRCRALGEREFPPGATLTSLATSGGSFAAQPRRLQPFAPLDEVSRG